MFSGSLCPGKYLTFSCLVLMISVSFCPSIISSYTYMSTRSTQRDGLFLTLLPIIFAITEPLKRAKNTLPNSMILKTRKRTQFNFFGRCRGAEICMEQEYIPVGCITSAAVAISGEVGGMFARGWGCLPHPPP